MIRYKIEWVAMEKEGKKRTGFEIERDTRSEKADHAEKVAGNTDGRVDEKWKAVVRRNKATFDRKMEKNSRPQGLDFRS